ncbi:MAG: thioesterase domain-containing protein [Rhizobiaceae bacterium]|nr:thioesterase domain-containing protein [Rhizobiaceae bacterium]
MFRVLLQSAAVAALTCFSVSAHALEVYMFKGAGDFSFVNENMHFSRGLNKMSEQLNAEGIRSEVRRFGAMDQALKLIRERKPTSIALVGHSMGALASMSLARSLKEDGINIAYMALLDIPGPVGVAGDNVDWVQNYYTINPVYGKLTNVRSHRRAENINILGYIHNRLDDAPKVQKGIMAAIREVHALEQQELVPENQPEILFVETPPAIQPQPAATQTQAYQPAIQPITPQPAQTAAAPVQQPYALPSVAPQPQIDPVTTATVSTVQAAQAPVPSRGVGETLASRVKNFLRDPERRRYNRELQSQNDR